jgi:hypothetical protein
LTKPKGQEVKSVPAKKAPARKKIEADLPKKPQLRGAEHPRSKKSEENIRTVLDMLASGQSLVSALKTVQIGYSTWMDWLGETEKTESGEPLSDRYARACDARAEFLADEIIDIADDRTGDYTLADGETVMDSEAIQRSRLRVDARKWVAAKLKPKKYGDRLVNEHVGAGGGPIESISRIVISAGPAKAE